MNFREKQYEKWLNNADECKNYFENVLEKGIVLEISDPKSWRKRHLEKSNHNLDFATLIKDIHGTIIKERFRKQTFYDWATIA